MLAQLENKFSKSAALEVRNLFVAYKGEPSSPRPWVLQNLSMSINAGEIVAVLGKSGAGKTTLLNVISGLVEPSKGSLLFPLAPEGDGPKFACVFQEDRLLPWRSAVKNVQLSLERLGLERRNRREAAMSLLAQVGLQDAADRYPWQLSGGMRSRVALARALALQAPLLLLDESFAKLDPQTRSEMYELLLALRERHGFSVLLVTHNVEEAAYLADRAFILRNPLLGGAIEVQLGTRNKKKAEELLEALKDNSLKSSD
ncbi:ABC transporter ATP-binding protein [Bradyrhizobium sp. dw_78]|uniref:ABC transporter ATP-binding protein n=1 Tax=Bradyrhizobium sp. dw_78 TaxID=2719793 RepID=UPI001BD42F06|nr:ABC transporter ATP-binding protein [Bradyrhizobium sp. dw_78]